MATNVVVAQLERWMIPALLEMGSELTERSSYTQPFDYDYARKLALQQVEQANPAFRVWMAWYKQGTYLDACGMIMGSTTQLLFSPAIMAVVETVYVRHMTSERAKIADELLSAFMHWASTERNASFMRAGESSGIEPRAVGAFMGRNGFRAAGTLYKKDIV